MFERVPSHHERNPHVAGGILAIHLSLDIQTDQVLVPTTALVSHPAEASQPAGVVKRYIRSPRFVCLTGRSRNHGPFRCIFRHERDRDHLRLRDRRVRQSRRRQIEPFDRRGAVGSASLRDVRHLWTVKHPVHLLEIRVEQTDHLAVLRQLEVHMAGEVLVICDEHAEATRVDEGQWWQPVFRRLGHRIVREAVAPHVYRQRLRIVEFDEVALEQHLASRQPFIDANAIRIADGHGHVHCPWTRNGQAPAIVAPDPADGSVGQLGPKLNHIQQNPIPIVEVERITVSIQPEAQMNPGGQSRIGKDHQILSRLDRRPDRKDELAGPLGVVAQHRPGQVHRFGPVIVEFDNVRIGSFMFERGLVRGQNLIDHQTSIRSVHRPGPRGIRALLPAAGGVLAPHVNCVRPPLFKAAQLDRQFDRTLFAPGPVRIVEAVHVVRNTGPAHAQHRFRSPGPAGRLARDRSTGWDIGPHVQTIQPGRDGNRLRLETVIITAGKESIDVEIAHAKLMPHNGQD